MALQLRVIAHSEVGLVRKENQDSGFASPTMLMVADGMGGAAAGDLASRIAIDELYRVDGQGRGEDMLDVLDEAARRANERLAELIDENPDLDGMGTTICGGLFDGQDFGVVHLGDSRAYLVRGNRMLRLTHDHSWVQSLIDEGRLGERAAFTHPHRSLLLRVLNGQPYSRPDLLLITLKDGDRLLLCTDGLCGLVDDPVIASALSLPDPQEAVDGLIEAAHEAGGSDNITLILADVIDPLGPDEAAPGEQTARLDPNDPQGREETTAVIPGAEPAKPKKKKAKPAEPDEELASPESPATPTSPSSPPSPAATASSPTTPPGALPEGTTTKLEPTGLDSVWSEIREAILAAPALQARGRAAGDGRLLGAAARSTPLTIAAVGASDDTPAPQKLARAEPREVKTTLAPAEADRYRPGQRRPRSRRWFPLAVAGTVILAIAAAITGIIAYGRSQFFVGDASGYVAIFRGFPGTIAGFSTHSEVERSDIQLADLPISWRTQIQAGVTVGSREAADTLIAQLQIDSDACVARRAEREAQNQPTATPTPSATATPAPTGTATARASGTPTATARPTPSPTPTPTPTPTPAPTAASTPYFPDDGC